MAGALLVVKLVPLRYPSTSSTYEKKEKQLGLMARNVDVSILILKLLAVTLLLVTCEAWHRHTTTTCEANPTLLSWLLPSTCLDPFTKGSSLFSSGSFILLLCFVIYSSWHLSFSDQ